MAKLSIVKVKLDREVNGYVLSCSSTKEAVVIDPGLPVEKIAEQLKGLKVRYILATHCHPGHVAGKDDLKELVGGETGLHPADAKQLIAVGESKPDPALDVSTLAAWTMLANELMNLDEVLNK